MRPLARRVPPARERLIRSPGDQTSGIMVVPDSTGVVQAQAEHGSSTGGLIESSPPGYEEEREQELAGVELEEVRKLQELVRRLEVQNQTLRNRGAKGILHGGAANSSLTSLPAGTNMNERLSSCEGVTGAVGLEDSGEELGGRDLELSPPQDSSSGEDMSPLPQADQLEREEEEEEEEDGGPGGGFPTLPCGNGAPGHGGQTPDSPSLDSYESETLAESDSGVDQSALDEVDVLNLEDDGLEMEEEDSWLYVSPKKQVLAAGPECALKWCRKVLDHPSPETEAACRTLLNRLDQTSRWRSMYSSPSASGEACSSSSGLLSPGYHKSTNKPLLTCGSPGYMRSALSSQSSMDSELSTSDDSISMGYKLQDLTDVQIMARLQEESLRQDYASSSASVSRRSSSASLQSLRRGGGAYSDQELDALSLEDEEDECCSLPQRRPRYSPSPLGSPRCLSPSPAAAVTGQAQGGGAYPHSRLGAPRTPRLSLQGPSPELLKFAKSEEELRRSMPNLAPRTSLRTLEAVRNSRSMEANLQASNPQTSNPQASNLQSCGGRMSRLPSHAPSSGVMPSRLRASAQSPLSLRAPVKTMGPVGSVTGARPASRGLPVVGSAGPAGGARRVQSPGAGGGGAYPVARGSVGAGRQGGAASRGRLSQPPRRSLGMTSRGPMSDESWKEGCY